MNNFIFLTLIGLILCHFVIPKSLLKSHNFEESVVNALSDVSSHVLRKYLDSDKDAFARLANKIALVAEKVLDKEVQFLENDLKILEEDEEAPTDGSGQNVSELVVTPTPEALQTCDLKPASASTPEGLPNSSPEPLPTSESQSLLSSTPELQSTPAPKPLTTFKLAPIPIPKLEEVFLPPEEKLVSTKKPISIPDEGFLPIPFEHVVPEQYLELLQDTKAIPPPVPGSVVVPGPLPKPEKVRPLEPTQNLESPELDLDTVENYLQLDPQEEYKQRKHLLLNKSRKKAYPKQKH